MNKIIFNPVTKLFSVRYFSNLSNLGDIELDFSKVKSIDEVDGILEDKLGTSDFNELKDTLMSCPDKVSLTVTGWYRMGRGNENLTKYLRKLVDMLNEVRDSNYNLELALSK